MALVDSCGRDGQDVRALGLRPGLAKLMSMSKVDSDYGLSLFQFKTLPMSTTQSTRKSKKPVSY